MVSGRWCVTFFFGSPKFIKESDVGKWQEVKKKTWHTKDFWDAMPLGRLPDSVLARILGIKYATLYAARERRGIPIMPDPAATYSSKSNAWKEKRRRNRKCP